MTGRTQWYAVATLLLLTTARAEAQVVHGSVQTDGGEPARGAIVTLLDDADQRLAPALVDERGAYLLVAPRAGTFRMRVDLIGYRTWTSTPFALAAADTTTRDVRLPLTRAVLPAVSVAAESRCEARPEQAPQLLAIWEEIRRALTINDIAERRGLVPVDLTIVREDRVGATRNGSAGAPIPTMERIPVAPDPSRRGRPTTSIFGPPRPQPQLGPRPVPSNLTPGRTVNREQDRLRSVGARPWRTRSPADLAEHGYVRVVDGAEEYAGLDAPIILSSEFVATHCFRPVRKNALFGADAVGLAFEPVRGRELPDVKGTLWLDAKSSELRRVEFTLVNLPTQRDNVEAPEGALEFARLPAGTWYVREWTMEQDARLGSTRFRKTAHGVAVPVRAVGSARQRATIAGLVVDSTVGDALAGAVVSIPGLEPVVTDSVGRFVATIADLPEDSLDLYVRVDHPRLAELELASMQERVRVFAGRDVAFYAGLPSVATLSDALCRADEGGDARDGGLVFGRAVRADGGAVAAGTRVVVEWASDERLGQGVASRTMQRAASVLDDGRFRLCAVPVGRSLRLKLDGARNEALEIVVPTTGLAQVELTAVPDR